MANLAELSEAKTTLRVSELRLKRRLAAVELSELRASEAAKEAVERREALEEECLRARDATSLVRREAASRPTRGTARGGHASSAKPSAGATQL